MAAGDLRDKVGFYKRLQVEDDYGNTESVFPLDPEFEVAANIKPKLGGEDVLAGRLSGRNLVNITVRKSSATLDVTTDWVAKDERSGELYNIRSIIDPDQHTARHGRFLEMLCEEGVAAGLFEATLDPSFDFSDRRNSGYLVLLEDI